MAREKSTGLNYNHTLYACYAGYITQAVVNNFAPLLFLTFASQFGLTLDKIALITTVNFSVQLAVDLVSAKIVDRIGYRKCILAAHLAAGGGMIALAVLPYVLPDAYSGILAAVVLYAIGGGLIEVMISPIAEACPTEKKEAVMSLLHSFYCWGHVGVVVLSTLYFHFIGIGNWRVLSVLWALIPLSNCFLFMKVPLFPITPDERSMRFSELFRQKEFWVLMLLMVCAGASEQGMSQWASAFAESALKVPKSVGDLAGPCMFALAMGTSRALYGRFSDKLPLIRAMVWSAVLCIIAYLMAAFSQLPVIGLAGCALCGFSVGIFWPGTFSAAAWTLPAGGTAMYALMALAGDAGCASGPTLVGFAAGAFSGDLKTGLLFALVFPVLIILNAGRVKKKEQTGENGS